jgi:hypothetical protein
MPVERAEHEDQDPLSVLGHVEPPTPGVLERARERLWSAVAGEALVPLAEDNGRAASREQDSHREHREHREYWEHREHRTGPDR